MNLPPVLATRMQEAEISALHWSTGDLTKPSVLQLRTRDLHPSKYLPLLVAAIEQSADALLAGALVSVHEADARIRILPLRAPKP
jgi:predicted nuclease of predicted toxin-antitoxin system